MHAAVGPGSKGGGQTLGGGFQMANEEETDPHDPLRPIDVMQFAEALVLLAINRKRCAAAPSTSSRRRRHGCL